MSQVSLFEIFKIGIGPSSSHTVGPMLAARHFVTSVLASCLSESEWDQLDSINVKLYGSLSLTGKGHGTDRAVICGLEGYTPDSISPDLFNDSLTRIQQQSFIFLDQRKELNCDLNSLIEFHHNSLPLHPNGLSFEAKLKSQQTVITRSYYSVGGGFIIDENGTALSFAKGLSGNIPYNFSSADELLALCKKNNKSIADIILENEKTIRSEAEIKDGINKIWQTMDQSIARGCSTGGILPGGLKVERRATKILAKLKSAPESSLSHLDYLSCYALAVNEENAAFGRVVTAPTNGAAGVIPAVFKFYIEQLRGKPEAVFEYLLTATAIAILFKSGASLSAAEMGCQGEIGVATSMAAAALTAIQGGSPMQVENAAEIGIEHSLGLTCDPIAGLVQIPCIERNAIGSNKAVTASQLALKSDGQHIVSLDQAISAMKKTGQDMHSKYKETSTGGLAISVAAPEC
jgi:L-serine dehydratase